MPGGGVAVFVDWPDGYQVKTNRRGQEAWPIDQREARGEKREAGLSEAGPKELGDQIVRWQRYSTRGRARMPSGGRYGRGEPLTAHALHLRTAQYATPRRTMLAATYMVASRH